MKYIVLFLVLATFVNAESEYNQIHKRNAFGLQEEKDILPKVPPLLQKPPIKLNLTGITTNRGVTNIHLYAKDHTKKFITLNRSNKSDQGITLLHARNGRVTIDNNGTVEVLSFATHKIPNVITLPANKAKLTQKRSDNNKETKTTPATPQPNVITVPSRRGSITDPRMQKMMEKGLEYVSKIEDPKKREMILERMEKFQRGDYDKEMKERIKRYEERKK